MLFCLPFVLEDTVEAAWAYVRKYVVVAVAAAAADPE